MSLDVHLLGAQSLSPGTGIFIRENGSNREITRAEWDSRFPGYEPITTLSERKRIFSLNITHNLGKMAAEAGIYDHLWVPEEIGITVARQLVEPLTKGLARLKGDPDRARRYNPPNGWGSYEGLVAFVEQYLSACIENPNARVEVSR